MADRDRGRPPEPGRETRPQRPARPDATETMDGAETLHTDEESPFVATPGLGPAQPGALDDTVLRRPQPRRSSSTPDLGDFPEVDRTLYEVGVEVARGGLGRILESVDRRLNRTVAVKELISQDGHAEGRFIREAMITARLEHPSIVPIHEAGRWHTGERFYAMKLVHGRTLSDALEEAETDADRLSLLPAVIDVCEAVAYAHSQGILHRDLKPSNVMVGSFGETVLIDWGLAKDLNDPLDVDPPPVPSEERERAGFETSDGIVVGTPPYMSPEQAAAKPLDQRSDVYALGAILYHVLSGYRPYQNIRPSKVLQAVVSHPPTDIQDLAPDMPRDLIAIVNKAMARDAGRRYPSAREMAEELRRFQTGQLVGAHDYTPVDLLRRFVRRNKAAVATAALAFTVLLGFGAWSFENIREQRNQAEANAEVALHRLDLFRLERARALLDRDPTHTLAQLERIEDLSHVTPGAATLAAAAVDRGVAKHILEGHEDVVNMVRVAPDGRRVASASTDGTVRLWDVETGEGRILEGHDERVSTVDFSPDGRLLASGSHDHSVRLWDVETGESRVLRGHEAAVKWVTFSPDGRLIASTSEDETVRVWPVDGEDAQVLYVKAADRNVTAAFSPSGDALVTGGHGERVWLWDLERDTSRVFEDHDAAVKWVAFSPDGRWIASSDVTGQVRARDLERGTTRVFRGHAGLVQHLEFAPDARRLASAGLDRTVRVWDLYGEDHLVFEGHEERISMVHFCGDGEHVLSASWDGTARIWDVETRESRTLLGHGDVVSWLDVGRDAEVLATGSWDKTVRIWRLDHPHARILRGHTIGVHGVDFSPGGDLLASGGHDNAVRLWDLETGRVRVLEGHTDHIFRVFFSPDGEWVASSSDDRTVRLWNVRSGEAKVLEGHEADVEELAFSPDGRRLASAGEDDVVWLWEVPGGQGRALRGHTDHVTGVAFDPTGTRVASSSRDGTVRIWSVQTGSADVLEGHDDVVWSVDFSADGEEVVSAGSDGAVRVWDAGTGRLRRRYAVPGARIVRFSPNGRFVGVGTVDRAAWLCRRAYDLCDRLEGHGAVVWDLAFAPDGRALVTGSGDDTVRLWDVESTEHRVLRGHDAPVFDVAVSPDGRRVASVSADTTVRVWPLELPPRPDRLRAWIDEQTSANEEEPLDPPP